MLQSIMAFVHPVNHILKNVPEGPLFMSNKQKETIYYIAQKAGASASTVSAALNGTWKKRRISEKTAQRIIQIAREQGYTTNNQARALRTSRSGLVALLVPEYNRFFSNIAQTFSQEVRARNLCPVIISTERDPKEERHIVEDLSNWQIDSIFFVGSVSPEDLSRQCKDAQIPHVFVDQPCALAPSVVTDNRAGALMLTQQILASMPAATGDPQRDRVYFLGGDRRLPSTYNRIEGFSEAIRADTGSVAPDQIIARTYAKDAATQAIADLYGQLGGLPRGLFINSDSVFEGAMRFIATLPEDELQTCAFGCFDYEPFGQLLRFPVHMIRQRHKKLVQRAFWHLEHTTTPVLEQIEPELYRAKT
jgi:LacI family fructose operon transcriptional repressor